VTGDRCPHSQRRHGVVQEDVAPGQRRHPVQQRPVGAADERAPSRVEDGRSGDHRRGREGPEPAQQLAPVGLAHQSQLVLAHQGQKSPIARTRAGTRTTLLALLPTVDERHVEPRVLLLGDLAHALDQLSAGEVCMLPKQRDRIADLRLVEAVPEVRKPSDIDMRVNRSITRVMKELARCLQALRRRIRLTLQLRLQFDERLMQQSLQFRRRTYPGRSQPGIEKAPTKVRLASSLLVRLIHDQIGLSALTNDEDQPVQAKSSRLVELQLRIRQFGPPADDGAVAETDDPNIDVSLTDHAAEEDSPGPTSGQPALHQCRTVHRPGRSAPQAGGSKAAIVSRSYFPAGKRSLPNVSFTRSERIKPASCV